MSKLWCALKYRGKVKHELQVQILKSTNYEFKSTSDEFKSANDELKLRS